MHKKHHTKFACENVHLDKTEYFIHLSKGPISNINERRCTRMNAGKSRQLKNETTRGLLVVSIVRVFGVKVQQMVHFQSLINR